MTAATVQLILNKPQSNTESEQEAETSEEMGVKREEEEEEKKGREGECLGNYSLQATIARTENGSVARLARQPIPMWRQNLGLGHKNEINIKIPTKINQN